MQKTKSVIAKFSDVEFESSSSSTPQFREFASMFKKALKEQCELAGAKLEAVNVGHFYISGFAERNGEYVYFSTSDVRYFRNEWVNHVLVRTATGLKDYTGGSNNYCELLNLSEKINQLIK